MSRRAGLGIAMLLTAMLVWIIIGPAERMSINQVVAISGVMICGAILATHEKRKP